MSAYQQTVDIAADTSYPTDPQVELPFEPKQVLFVNEDNAATLFVSFDGKEDQGKLLAGNGVTFFQRARRIWLRRSGGGGTVPINVMAES